MPEVDIQPEEEGRSVAEVAENLGISKDLIYRWRREYRSRESLAFPGHKRESLSQQERRIRDLEKDLQDTRMERDILKKDNYYLQQSTEMKYQFITDNRSLFPVDDCRT
jgi:transposase